MTQNCSYCCLPFSQKSPSPLPFCSYACQLASQLKGKNKKWVQTRLGVGIFGFVLLLYIFYAPVHFLPDWSENTWSWLLFSVTTFILLLLGAPFFKIALSNLWQQKKLSHELLIVVAVVLDYGYSTYTTILHPHFFTQALSLYPPYSLTTIVLTVNLFVLLSEALARKACYDDLLQVSHLRPQSAIKIIKNQEVKTLISELKIGDVIKVGQGEIIPCDGVITSGTTSVDETQLISEKTILLKTKGDSVTGASLNRDGPILVKIVKEPSQHFLEQIISIFTEAIGSLPKIHHRLEQGYYMGIIGVGILIIIGFFYFSWNPSQLITMLLVSLFIFIGLGGVVRITPMVVALGIGRAAKHGILIRSGELFSKLATLDYLFFEKTGTISRGHFIFSQLFMENGVNQGEILSTIFSLEEKSEHWLAQGVKTHPWYLEISRHPVADLKQHTGLGICGTLCAKGHPEKFVAIGNIRFLKRQQMQVSKSMRDKIDMLEAMGETVILCGWNGWAKGLMSFADILRSDVQPLLKSLTHLKISPVVITGDHDSMIANLTHTHGIQDVYTRCLPEEKARKITNRQEQGYKVGMVGNSTQEGESFKRADVAITLGSNTNLIEDVGVIILGKKLLHLTNLIGFSRKVYATIRYGFLISLVYCGGALTLSFLGILKPLGALFIMATAHLLFMLLPLWLKRVKFVVG